jgi:hypothetical protein
MDFAYKQSFINVSIAICKIDICYTISKIQVVFGT